MTSWVRSKLPVLCGLCGRVIAAYEPLEVIAVEKVRRRLLRGACCAESEVPENVEELPFHHDASVKPLDLSFLDRLSGKLSDQDWTARILGEKN